MPMTFDTYSNCFFGCLYCFSQYQRGVGKSKQAYFTKQVRPVNVQAVKRLFENPGGSQFETFIRERRVMQWGGLSDPFCYFERKYGVTLELLRFFRSIDYPICFSTKGTWWLNDPRYVEVFKGAKNWNVKITIITEDYRAARIIERGVASPSERLWAIERVAALGAGGVTLRLRPFIIGISNPTHIDLIKHAAEAGGSAVSTEFFCLDLRAPEEIRRNYRIISQIAGYDIVRFYRRYSLGSGYLRMNRNVKREFVDQMEQACRENGLRFYVSDAHFKERCDNGSCCGLPESWNYSRGQWCEALMIAKRRGRVMWADIAPHLEYAKGFEWQKAIGYNTNSVERRAKFMDFSMYDYLQWTWNHPSAGQSPYHMFEGIMRPCGKDQEGNWIYEYDRSRE
ncbi:MAG: radical SAM protein [Chloroflexota bacterium]